ncbi:MAG: MarR family transcriptional regulator [Pseudomonadota bacterium]
MRQDDLPLYFQLFNEIGIISQLSRAAAEAEFEDGLLMTHFSVLNHLIRVRDGQTPLALARAFQVPKTSMTHTLAGLEKRGLIEMRPNPGDGRSKQVWLTEAGRAWRNGAIAQMGQNFAHLATAFPAERIEAVLPVLTELRQFLDAARDGP